MEDSEYDRFKCYLQVQSRKKKWFLETIKREGIDASSRAEVGNIKYDYYLSDADVDELFNIGIASIAILIFATDWIILL